MDGQEVTLFSARLDETGTDGCSKFMLVGGAIATPQNWDALEKAWNVLLREYGVCAYHWKEFNDQNNETFGGWSRSERDRFISAQESIVAEHTYFRVSVGVERAIHADIKRRMKGITGFHPKSDYSLCLHWLMFHSCEQLVQEYPDCRLNFLVEDGPWTPGALQTYQRVATITAKRQPAKHAHHLAGFSSAPKGERPSLEAADYIAGSELKRLLAGGKRASQDTLAVMLNERLLEQWYKWMIEEKEARREFARNRKAASSPS